MGCGSAASRYAAAPRAWPPGWPRRRAPGRTTRGSTALAARRDRAGRVLVEPDLSIPGHPEAFAIGDMCAFVHQTATPLPGVAQVAIQQGRVVADNVLRRLSHRPTRAFHYRDKGSMATIGRAAA